jgi:RNA polymerase sigma factor (sigma-70 family)
VKGQNTERLRIMQMKTTCGYPDFTEFENRLIKRLSSELKSRFHLTYQDREDIQQELAVFLWQQKDGYDPEHSSGCRYETYITKCLERKSLEILRSVCPDIDVETDDVESALDSPATFSGKRIGQAADISALYLVTTSSAFSRLTPEQKDIFRQLGAGKSIARIAADFGVSYTTMHTRVCRLRSVLKLHGFDLSMN